MPLVLQSPIEISLGLLDVGLAIVLSIVLPSPDTHSVTLVADAIGLAAFATTGAIIATEAGLSALGVVAIATINAVGGSAFADILLDRAASILFEDFYVSCAVFGGTTYLVVLMIGVSSSTSAVWSAVVTVGTRLVAVTYDWHLSTVQILA